MAVKKHYAVVVGARPNFIKAAAFFNRAKEFPKIKFTLIHTGQHFDKNMSYIFFDQMRIPKPDINLNIQGKYHTEKIGKMFTALKNIFKSNKFTGVIVFGDINSTLAGAIAATKHNQKLIHIEAGLRSHDRRMPEEINRAIVDHLSDLLFTTEPVAKQNLLLEGVSKNKIIHSGNIMIESLEIFSPHIESSNVLSLLDLKKKAYIVATIHRQENTDDKKILQKLLLILNKINKEVPIILPLHPGTKNKIKSYRFEKLAKDLKIIDPVGYFDFLKLVKESKGVITDSGGIQEETSHMGVACATLRDNTERPITISHGTNKLFPVTDINERTYIDILKHLKTNNRKVKIDKWDKNVTKRIFKYL